MAVFNVPQLYQDAGVLDLREGATGVTLTGWQVVDGQLATTAPTTFYRAYPFASELSPQPWIRSQFGDGVDMTGVVQEGDRIRYRVSGYITADPNISYVRIGDVYIDASSFVEDDGMYFFASSFDDDISESQFVYDPATFNPSTTFFVGYSGSSAVLEVSIAVEAETTTPPTPIYNYRASWENCAIEDGDWCDWDVSVEDVEVNEVRVQVYRNLRGQAYTTGTCVGSELVINFSDEPDVDRLVSPGDYYFNNEPGNLYITDIYVPEADEPDLIVLTLSVQVTTNKGVFDTEMKAYLGWGG